MTNIKSGFVFKSMFGLIPKTADIESAESALQKEYNDFVEFGESDLLKKINDLEKLVKSPDFKKKLDLIKADTFDKTKEYKELQTYNSLKKSSLIKNYFKYLNSGLPERTSATEKSEKLKKFNELKQYINTPAFINKKAELLKEKTYKESPEATKEDEFLQLKKDSELKNYFKTIASSKYKRFLDTSKSKDLADYNRLHDIVNSQEFLDFKAEKEDKERYKKSEEFKTLSEYEQLMKDEKVVTYFKLLGSNKFDELKKWNISFIDDFTEKKLDSNKWITNYFWGKALLKEGYSLSTDLHCNTEGNNIEIKDSVCKIITRKEKSEGKSWNPRVGFYPREFDYTSGLISTGESFRQKYGKFQVKARLNSSSDITNAFWMVSDKMLPEIDVFKSCGKNKLAFINQWGKDSKTSISRMGGSKFSNGFFIFTLEWDKDKISWKINDILLKEVRTGVPQEPMYMILSSGINSQPDDSRLPATFEIDWVRCYEKVK